MKVDEKQPKTFRRGRRERADEILKVYGQPFVPETADAEGLGFVALSDLHGTVRGKEAGEQFRAGCVMRRVSAVIVEPGVPIEPVDTRD